MLNRDRYLAECSDARYSQAPRPPPQDADWFGEAARPVVISAVSDLSWLLSRGYAEPSSLKLVGDCYRLVECQRVAVGSADVEKIGRSSK